MKISRKFKEIHVQTIVDNGTHSVSQLESTWHQFLRLLYFPHQTLVSAQPPLQQTEIIPSYFFTETVLYQITKASSARSNQSLLLILGYYSFAAQPVRETLKLGSALRSNFSVMEES